MVFVSSVVNREAEDDLTYIYYFHIDVSAVARSEWCDAITIQHVFVSRQLVCLCGCATKFACLWLNFKINK